MEKYICARFSKEKYQDDSVAQLVEQYTFNVWALGSNPSGITKMEEEKQRTVQKAVLVCSS